MIILPAIDLKDGKCVRLFKGDFKTVHEVTDDAVKTAEDFKRAGSEYIHMVDLDAAKSGERKNWGIIEEVAKRSGLKVELGGGIRMIKDLERADRIGVYRMVIGSAAVSDPDFVKAAVEKYGDRIAVGIDAKEGLVRTKGWTENAGINYIEFARKMEGLNVKYIIFTDIDTDGTLSGPPLKKLVDLKKSVSSEIIASGGIANLEDIRKLKEIGIYGAIIGKAYYAGTIDLEAAIGEAGG